MFEQSVLIDHPANKSWSMLVSLFAQVMLVSAAVAVPLIFTDRLPQFQWNRIFVNAPVPPPPAHVIPERSIGRAPEAPPTHTPRVFVAPSHIPDKIVTGPDEPVPAVPGPPLTGVPFSTGTTPGNSLIENLIQKPAPPPVVARKPDKPMEPVPRGGRVQAAKLVKQVIPLYPPLARTARISGTVRLQGIIGKDGTIQNLQLISGPPLLVQAALEAVRQWVYKPTLLNGETVEVIAPIDVVFTLNQ